MGDLETAVERRLVVGNLPVFQHVDGHHSPVPFFLTADMFGGLPMAVAGAEISGLAGKPVAEPHTHEVPEIYLLLSPEPDGAEIDILLDGEHFSLSAQGAFYIPAGKTHQFVTRRAMPGSYCLGILLSAAYP